MEGTRQGWAMVPASPRSDRAVPPQLGDAGLVEPEELGQDLLAVLAEIRRGLAVGDRGGGEADRVGDQVDRPLARKGMRHGEVHLPRLDLRVCEDLVDR